MFIRKRSLRFSCVFLFLISCLTVFSAKLILIQIFRSDHLAGLAKKQQNHTIRLEPIRGTIFDRKSRPLALNIAAYSLYANPKMMQKEHKQEAMIILSKILGLEPSFINDRLQKKKYFVWLARKLTVSQMEEIKAQKVKGLDFVKESKRHYPNQYLAAHIIGFAGMDNVGLEGLELIYNKTLQGEAGWSYILRDARQRDLLLEDGFVPPQNGLNLVLTIDETIQFIAERALEKAFIKHNAKSGSIIVMDPQTGEILALANRPTYNLTMFSQSNTENRTNRAIAHVFEPGSVFKIVTASAALEEEIAEESDRFFCENGEYRIANHVLHDHHPHGTLTFREVFEKSSNICTAKIAQKMGPNTFFKHGKRFRFGMKTGIDLMGEVDGVFKAPSQWSKTSIGAIPMGHEVTVTPLQLATAISTVANGGIYMKPFIVKYIKDNQDELIKAYQPTVVDRVISRDTAERVTSILNGVVENGTGKRAQIEGIRVAGKTGTAQKVIEGKYSHNKFFATFIGFAPIENPRLAIVVMLDEPHPSYFGGTVSAPVFQEVMADSLKYLESTDDPQNTLAGFQNRVHEHLGERVSQFPAKTGPLVRQ